jgi:hypothetical protein
METPSHLSETELNDFSPLELFKFIVRTQKATGKTLAEAGIEKARWFKMNEIQEIFEEIKDQLPGEAEAEKWQNLVNIHQAIWDATPQFCCIILSSLGLQKSLKVCFWTKLILGIFASRATFTIWLSAI